MAELRVSDSVMSHARAGNANYKAKVAIAFRERVLKDNNGNGPRWVEFDELKFTTLRAVPPAAKKSTRTPKRQALQVGVANYDDVGEGGCGCDCQPCDLNLRHCGVRANGCKKG